MLTSEFAWGPLASAALQSGDLARAEEIYRTHLQLTPDEPYLRYGLAWILLSQGEWVEGWPLYEARHEIPALNNPKPPLPFPEWRGEALSNARVLIWPEQGLGDQIMYARYALWMRDQGADVTLVCALPLAGLFQRSFEAVRVIAMTGAAEFPTPNYWVMSGSLVGRAGHGPGEVPSAPYLAAEPVGDVHGVGVMTRGNPAHANDANRSLDPVSAERLRRLPGAVSLHPSDTGFSSFLDTARRVAGLSAVVSVDTAVAHLAGAMGKPATVLLPKQLPDWRWLNPTDGRPWYPSMRLIRQADATTWAPELDEVEGLFAARKHGTE